jgi:hypothetical protein
MKTFDSIKIMREQKDRLSVKLSKISKEENLEYFRK